MRSLFGKLLVWFVATVAISGLGFVLSTAMNFAGQSRQPPFGLLMTLQLSEARSAYERGGSILLTETLDRFRAVLDADCFLADSLGHDLSSGEDRSELIGQISAQPRISLFSSRVAFARRSPDNLYWYVMFLNRRSWFRWFFSTEHIWIFGIVVLLCYGFAVYLTWPLRQLRQALDLFGHGDLSVRADARRRDEMGDLGRSFNRMADRIQTLLAAERRLLLDISHELRSPLARLSLAVELARSGGDKEQALDRIQKEADRVNTLLTELLQVTRAEGDPSQRTLERVPLEQLVRQVVEDGAVEAKARGCGITLVSGEPIAIQGDYELIRRAAENVVRNAIRFSPPETTVEVSLKRDAHEAVIEVRDYGPGVPEEALGRIFDAFYRVESDRGRSTGGVGLGLSIAKRAIELHRGSLRARNQSPGLRVELRIPAAA